MWAAMYPIEDALSTLTLQAIGIVFVVWLVLLVTLFVSRSIRW
jgi:hypothetical protein